jgi:acyl dehydratase
VIERSRLCFFAKAIGETSPIYLDETAARKAGHSDIPAPPTFLFSSEMNPDDLKLQWLREAGVPLAKVLHGEQSFVYHRLPHAGDAIRVISRISDIYEKKNGALQFIVFDTTCSNERGEAVAELRSTIVVRS